MTSIEQNAIYRGNSIISIEKIEEYPHPVSHQETSQTPPVPAKPSIPGEMNTK